MWLFRVDMSSPLSVPVISTLVGLSAGHTLARVPGVVHEMMVTSVALVVVSDVPACNPPAGRVRVRSLSERMPMVLAVVGRT